MYLGMLLLLAGLGLLTGNLLTFLALPVYVLFVTYRFILREEKALESRFGEAYRGYCARVRRWI
jgi:protein-S-isoprenylcysteine O-methyltransferase Ste14